MNIYHGTAIAKEDIGELIKKGDTGIITAYLPEDNTYVLSFLVIENGTLLKTHKSGF